MIKYIAYYSDDYQETIVPFNSKLTLDQLDQRLNEYINNRTTIALFVTGLPDIVLSNNRKYYLQINTVDAWFTKNKVIVK